MEKVTKQRRKWGTGRKTANGYQIIKMIDHPYSDKNGYVYEHRLIVEKSIGRYLLPDERIHHIDGDKTNNNIDNLQITSHREHRRKHKNPTANWSLLENEQWLKKQIECGKSALQIAKIVGCWDHAVRYALDRYNVRKITPKDQIVPKYPELLDEAWLREKSKTMSQRQIANLLGCNQRLVWKYRNRYNIVVSHKPGPKSKIVN